MASVPTPLYDEVHVALLRVVASDRRARGGEGWGAVGLVLGGVGGGWWVDDR